LQRFRSILAKGDIDRAAIRATERHEAHAQIAAFAGARDEIDPHVGALPHRERLQRVVKRRAVILGEPTIEELTAHLFGTVGAGERAAGRVGVEKAGSAIEDECGISRVGETSFQKHVTVFGKPLNGRRLH
jgi:hypothetical protein